MKAVDEAGARLDFVADQAAEVGGLGVTEAEEGDAAGVYEDGDVAL